MHQSRFTSALTAVVVFLVICATLTAATPWLLSQPGRLDSIAPVLYPPSKTQGLLLQRMAFGQPDLLPVYGSSELTPLDRFHPSAVFAGKPAGFMPFLVGRGGCQSLVHLLSFASLGADLHDKKLVLILSPQWFERQGISQYYFTNNFSALQAYRFTLSTALSSDLKRDGAARLLQFEEVQSSPLLSAMLRGLVLPDTFHSVVTAAATPLARLQLGLLEQLDKLRSAYLVLAENQKFPVAVPQMEPDLWPRLMAEAALEGAAASTNNEYGMANEPYDRRFASQYQSFQDSELSTSYADSVEFADFDLLLRTLRELGADPLIVMVPVNGAWYDYIGFSRADRDQHYAKTRAMINSYGFKLADFSGHEYDKSFLRDDMHLGWKGWVTVDEAMVRYYQGD